MCAMPLREQEFVELCHLCKKKAAGPCLRCGIMLCEEHGPRADDERCPPCEAKFKRQNERLEEAARGILHSQIGRFSVGLICGLTVPTVTLAAIAIGTVSGGVLGALLGAGVAAATGAGAVAWYRHTPPRQLSARLKLRKNRRKFLRKRARGLLRSKNER